MNDTCGYTERLQQEDQEKPDHTRKPYAHKTPRTWDILSGRMFFNHAQGPELDPYPLKRGKKGWREKE